MKYERPDLEELQLELEGSFLTTNTLEGGIDETPVGPGTGDEKPDSPWN